MFDDFLRLEFNLFSVRTLPIMTWFGYLNENKNTLIVAMTGAVLADCIVLFAIRRYFTNYASADGETIEVLRYA